MKFLRVDHQSLEDKGFDLSLFDRWSRYCCFDRRIDSITLFLRFLKAFQSHGVSICLAWLLFDVLQIINASSVSLWKTKLIVGVCGAASSTVFGFGSYESV